MKMKTFITSFLILLATISIAQTEINAYPSNWWIGMKNPTLQLMLHANTDLPKSVKINKTGVIIQKIFQPGAYWHKPAAPAKLVVINFSN